MKRELLHANFLGALHEKIPQRSKLTHLLTDILCIEKEAVYRRLRGQVAFSFEEIAAIADRLAISLDGIMGIQSEKTKNFILQLSDFENPTEVDIVMWENYNKVLSIFNHHQPFSIFETWTTLPFPICYKFLHLTRFYIYEWAFQVHNHIPVKKYEEFVLNEKLLEIGMKTHIERTRATDTHFIFSGNFIQDFVRDVLFFKNIYFLSGENVACIQRELSELVDYLESLSENGAYPETGQKVSLYICEVGIKTDFTLYEASNNYISLIRTLVMNSASSTDEASYQYMKNWFDSIKRLSVCISNSGQKERVMFFRKQREIIASLSPDADSGY
ncbi:MAG: hypothetical protein LUH10_05850 [Tannerellaceae bacterium]|nr:hypothetical protein [Tannerellaceae bacterium]